MTEAFDADLYRSFVKAADVDTRVGTQTFMVTEVVTDAWPSGDPRQKVKGVLSSANNSKISIDGFPLPPNAEIKAEKEAREAKKPGNWSDGKYRAVTTNLQVALGLKDHYGKTVDALEAGDEFSVKVVKNKEGFLRVVAILDPKAAKAEPGAAKAKSDIPF